ncbi:unnamed protein product [Dibothriocephalus latus]|uniref:Uncharacterized protein n=1 Tax=Dibothriocephalus latus TaxID=60516 RepID=A0A3P7LH29_DIBLA|nr:unnamed protein product [Dibothriocephalus latus]
MATITGGRFCLKFLAWFFQREFFCSFSLLLMQTLCVRTGYALHRLRLTSFYSAQELAGKVLPCLSFLTVDAEKEIRDIALRALHGMLERLEKASEDPTFGEPDLAVVGKEETAGSTPGAVGILKSGTSAASGLLGNWALSALTSISNRLITQSAAAQKPTPVQSTPAGDSSNPILSDWDTSDWLDEKSQGVAKRGDWGNENRVPGQSAFANQVSPKVPKAGQSEVWKAVDSPSGKTEDTAGWDVDEEENEFFGKSSSTAAVKQPAKMATPAASTDWTSDWTADQDKTSGFTDNPDSFFD